MLEPDFEERVEKLSKDQLIFLAGAYEGLARRHYRKRWEEYFDLILKEAEGCK